MKNNKGFSLVELIVVIAIMAILAAVAIPTFATFINKANVASDKQFVDDMKYAVELANTEFGKDVTEFDVVCAADGDITTVTYKVDGVLVTITVAEANTATAASQNSKYQSAAQSVIDTMDWTYEFKSNDYINEYKAD